MTKVYLIRSAYNYSHFFTTDREKAIKEFDSLKNEANKSHLYKSDKGEFKKTKIQEIDKVYLSNDVIAAFRVCFLTERYKVIHWELIEQEMDVLLNI